MFLVGLLSSEMGSAAQQLLCKYTAKLRGLPRIMGVSLGCLLLGAGGGTGRSLGYAS